MWLMCVPNSEKLVCYPCTIIAPTSEASVCSAAGEIQKESHELQRWGVAPQWSEFYLNKHTKWKYADIQNLLNLLIQLIGR